MVTLCLWAPGVQGPYCPPEGVPIDARGGPGRPCLTAQHARSAGDQGGPSWGPSYTALDRTTPQVHPPSIKAVVPLEKRVCLQERPGEERQGVGQKTVLRSALFCMVAAFLPFLFFGLAVFVGWRPRGRYDGWNWGAQKKWGGDGN